MQVQFYFKNKLRLTALIMTDLIYLQENSPEPRPSTDKLFSLSTQ